MTVTPDTPQTIAAPDPQAKLNKQIVVRVDADLYAALQRDAEEHGRTVSQSLRFYARKAIGGAA